MSETIPEPIKVCINIPPDMSAEAQRLAIEENPENAVPAFDALPESVEENARLRLALITAKKWQPGRTLRVRFLDGDPVVHRKIEAYAHQWSQHANIKFEFGSDPNAEIRISCRQDGTSWSYLGTDALNVDKDKPTMNYGWLTPTSPDEEYSRVVLHEFGHALGCIHEHQHPEAGIPWNREAVYRYYMGPPNNWTKEQVDNNLFRLLDRDSTQFSQFDTQSIMLYAIPKELTIGGFEVGWNRQLSVTDKQFIGRTYPAQGGSSKVVIYSDRDYQGLSQELEPGRYDVSQLAIGNDHLSSLRVSQGLRVILYEHGGFQGRAQEFTSDTPYVGNDFNDITSSIEIQPIP
jgi:hypothetical protein